MLVLQVSYVKIVWIVGNSIDHAPTLIVVLKPKPSCKRMKFSVQKKEVDLARHNFLFIRMHFLFLYLGVSRLSSFDL